PAIHPGPYPYVEAAAAAGYFLGDGQGNLLAGQEITQEQLAIVLVKVLGLTVDDNATYEGATEKGAKFVAAAVAAGLIPADADLQAPAKRELLVTAAFTANEAIKKAEE